MEDSRKSFGYHQNPLPLLTDGLTFPDFLKIRPPPFSPPIETTRPQSRYEIPKSVKNGDSRPLTHPFLPPKPNIPPPSTPTQDNFYEIASPTKSRLEAFLDSKSCIRSQTTPPSHQSPGQHSNRHSSETTSYAQRTSLGTDRRSFMHSTNEFSPMHNDLGASLMGSSGDSRVEAPNRYFQAICPPGRRIENRQKTTPTKSNSWLFNERTAKVYFICIILLLIITTGVILLKRTKQYVYSDDDLISVALPEHSLEFGSTSDVILAPRRLTYFELSIQHDTNLDLLFNISDSQARFVVYARQTLPPTPTTYNYRRIVTADHLHYRSEQKTKRSVSSEDVRQIFEETQVHTSLITIENVQAGKWYFAFLNDNTRPLSIVLRPVAKNDQNKLMKSHSCKFDCFGKGTCIRNQCVCYPGFRGHYCQETLCPVLCSGNGILTNGQCICHEKFKGPVCDESVNSCRFGQCEDAFENQVPEALNANRSLPFTNLLPELSTPKSTIETYRQIENENEEKTGCTIDCGNHGTCINGSCVCQPEWNGESCSIYGCENNCNSNGLCQLIGNDEYKCFCNNTHFGPNCQYPLEVECSDEIDNDGDGLIDCADSECCTSPHCSNHPLCISDLQQFIIPQSNPTNSQTSFKKQIEFLLNSETGQKYADPMAFVDSQISVLRGRVLSKRAGPLTGVRISNLMSPKQGFTLTRSSNGGGSFNFVCNGGGLIRLSFLRHPFGAVEKSFYIKWNEIHDVGDIFIDEEIGNFNSSDINEKCRSAQISHNFKPKMLSTPIEFDSSNSKSEDGSRVDLESRSLRIRSTIKDSNGIQLVYNSDRSPQTHSLLYIQLLNGEVSLNLELVRLRVQIAGRIFEKTFKATKNLQYIFSWDRRNVFGHDVIGLTNANVEISYQYNKCGNNLIRFMENVQLEGRHLLETGFGTWSLSIQHHYDPTNRILERGDGKRVYFDKTPLTVKTIVGSDQRPEICSNCQNNVLSSAKLYSPRSIINLPDGSVVFGDHNLIRRTNGQKIESILEIPIENAKNYYLALDSANNEVYITLNYQVLKLKKLEKVRDPKNNYRVIAGSGEECETDSCSTGDNKIKDLKFHKLQGMSFDNNGGFYLIDGRSIRYINRKGELQNLVSTSDWRWLFECPNKFRLELLNLQNPSTIIVDPHSQDLFVLDSQAIYRINTQQFVAQLIAGNMHNCDYKHKVMNENLFNPQQMALDSQQNQLYFTESDGKQYHRVRSVDIVGGKLNDVAGAVGNCDCHRISCPCDEVSNKPLPLASNSLFHNPSGISVDQKGRIYIADSENYKIKVIEPALPTLQRGIYQINSPESDEILEFDENGRHLRTKRQFDGQNKYLFSYSTDDKRLVNIKMNQMNLTILTEDSNIVVRTQSRESTIQMKEVDNEYPQLYEISRWARVGVYSTFEYGENQLINKAKIGQKVTKIEYDCNGNVILIDDSIKKVELMDVNFDEAGKLKHTILINGKESGSLEQGLNELIVKDSNSQYLKRSNGFELDEKTYRQHYEFSEHPLSSLNGTFISRLRTVYPFVEKVMPEVVSRFEVQKFTTQLENYQVFKTNGQKILTNTFNPNTMTQKIIDPSGNDLLTLQKNSNNNIINVQFGQDSAINFSYNDFGQLESAEWLNRSLLNFYDENHNLIRQTIKSQEPDLSRSFAYKIMNRYLTTVGTYNGLEYWLEYEFFNDRLTKLKSPSGNEHLFNSENNSELIRTLPSGAKIKAVYDLNGNLLEMSSGNKAIWTRDNNGKLLNFNTGASNFNYTEQYNEVVKDIIIRSNCSTQYIKQGHLIRSFSRYFDEKYPTDSSKALYVYDDMSRIVQVTNIFSHKNLESTTNYAYDFMNRLTKIDDTLIIKNGNTVNIIHPKFDLQFEYTLDNQLEKIELNSKKNGKKINANFSYNSLSLLVSNLWKIDTKSIDSISLEYNNGKLQSFKLDEKEQKIEYDIDGIIKLDKIGEYLTNELGWIIEHENCSFSYDALGQLIELTNKTSQSTFQYIYDDKQRLSQIKTTSPAHKNTTFYYGHSNDQNQLSHFSFNDFNIFSLHYYENKPFLLEKLNGTSFALLTNPDNTIRGVIDENGNVVEYRRYTPFGEKNVSKTWNFNLPIGYMGFIENNGLVFVYDKEQQVTRPLNTQTGRFMSSSPSSLKSTFDVLNPDLEADLFYFDHGRSLNSIFPIDPDQWLKLSGIPQNQFTPSTNCGQLITTNTLCSLDSKLNPYGQMLDFNYPNSPSQINVPVL